MSAALAVLLAGTLAGTLAAVPSGAPTEVVWWLRLLFDVPAAIAAVAAAVAVTRRGTAGKAVTAGLAAAGAVLLVGSGGAVVLTAAPEMPFGAALSRIPTQAALAIVVVATAVVAGRARIAALRKGGRLLTILLALAAGAVVVPESASATADPAIVRPCAPGDEDRSYAVAAITVDVPFNRWGRLGSSRIFVLEQDRAAVQHWSRPLAQDAADDPAGNRRLRPRPLVLRANEGECVRVTLTNRLSDDAAHGLPADSRVSIEASGMVVTETVPCADGWVDVPADATEVVVRGRFEEGIVTSTVFDDADSDGRRDPGEAPLVSWPVVIGDRVATTDDTGRAWHVLAAGRYDVTTTPPAATVLWTPTTATATVEVAAATTVGTAGGWVQRGAVSVGVFHDHDRDASATTATRPSRTGPCD